MQGAAKNLEVKVKSLTISRETSRDPSSQGSVVVPDVGPVEITPKRREEDKVEKPRKDWKTFVRDVLKSPEKEKEVPKGKNTHLAQKVSS